MPPPIVTATLQSVAISSFSNIAAQFLDHWHHSRPISFSIADFLRFLILNVIVCPPNFLWQAWLERRFPAYRVRRAGGLEIELGGYDDKDKEVQTDFSWRNTFAKWFVDCIVVGAVMNTLAFLIIMGLPKGHSGEEIMQAIHRDTIPIIVAGYKIWPFASIVSFIFIPWESRIVFLSFIGFLWGIYMSVVAARQ